MLIDIFPNPASRFITVRCSDASQIITNLEVYSVSGKRMGTVLNLNASEFKLSVEEIPAGIYILRTKTIKGATFKLFTISE